MKIFLLAVLLVIKVGQCNAFMLQEINKDTIDSLRDDYIAEIFEKDNQGILSSNQLNPLACWMELWNEVASGKKKILLATDKDQKYVGHIFFSRKKDGCILLEIPGYSNQQNIPYLFRSFIRYARKVGHRRNSLVFDLPSKDYKELMIDLGFVESQSIDEQIQRFILTFSKKLKKLNTQKIASGSYYSDINKD